MIRGAFDGIAEAMATMFVLCLVFVPLGLWKLIEIVLWLFSHVDIGIK